MEQPETQEREPDVVIDLKAKRPPMDDQNWTATLSTLQIQTKQIGDLTARLEQLDNYCQTLQAQFNQIQALLNRHLSENVVRGGSTS